MVAGRGPSARNEAALAAREDDFYVSPGAPPDGARLGPHGGYPPIYSFYESAPRLWESFDAVADQRVAGLLMKLGGGLLLWGVIAAVFFRWYAAEESGGVDKSLTWDDFEQDLQAWDLRRT